jgi:hypothetical protein
MTDHRYEVALSFAGEDRGYVGRVATALRDRGVALFYDEFETALWGRDLFLYLHDVYCTDSRHVLVFLSASYARNMWTSHECRVIQARLIAQPDDFLLLVRLDDSTVPGFLPTLAYVDGRVLAPETLADLVVAKLGGAPAIPATQPIEVPLSEEGLRQVIARRPVGWEHLLLAGTVWREWDRLAAKRLDQDLGVAATVVGHVADGALPDFVGARIDMLVALLSDLEALVAAGSLTWAMGPPGTLGDVNRIQHLGRRFGTASESLLDWTTAVRGHACAPRHRAVLGRLAALAAEPVRQLGGFVDSLVAAAGLIAEAIATGDPSPEPIAIQLDLRPPDAAVEELLSAVAMAERDSAS